ncbi:MAG TPA: hypothetical protein VM123_16480 [archaeon]|nr:hypothetical protein [archaeon]
MSKDLKPFSLLVKPVGSRCNLDCSYCFYLGTDENLEGSRPAVMPQEVLTRMLEDYLGLGFPTSIFTWQGGEPTLAGLDFYRRVVEGQMHLGQRGPRWSRAGLVSECETSGVKPGASFSPGWVS